MGSITKYAGIAAITSGILLTLESISEGNSMLMWESIILAVVGCFYAFPVKEKITMLLQERQRRKESEDEKGRGIFDAF